MKEIVLFIFIHAVNNCFNVLGINDTRKLYLPVWEDLDTRPLPQWYESSKIGIFIHWGVYSVPSYKNEWFWYLWKTGMYEIVDMFYANILTLSIDKVT